MKRLLFSALLLSASATFATNVDEVDLNEADDTAIASAAGSVQLSKTDGNIDVSFDEETIADVLRKFRKTTGVNIIAPDSTNLSRRVSVSLKDVPWYDALESILNSRQFRIEQRNNIFYVEESQNKEITRSYVLNHASAEELADLFNGYKLKSQKVTDSKGNTEETIKSVETKVSAVGGKVRASAFPNANILVLSGLEADISECEKIIRSIDRAATQVYIEARFMELSSAAKHELGVKWDSLQKVGASAKASMTFSRAAEEKNLGNIDSTFSGTLTASEFGLFLSAFEEVGGSQIFSNPKVIISNGKEAVIDMTTKFPNLKITSQRNNNSGTSYTDYTAQLEEIRGDKEKGLFAGSAFFSWGISLNVKPRISPEGLISVKITPSISELDTSVFDNDGFYQVKGGSEQQTKDEEAAYGKYPIIRMKSINTDFTMKNGCTAVIGGLSRTTETDVDNGIPYLRKIPWIGPHLFGWKSREKAQVEIIICVTIGIANPETLQKSVGLPKNAVIGREYVEGRLLTPGDRKNGPKGIQEFDTRPIEEIRENPYPESDEEVDLQ